MQLRYNAPTTLSFSLLAALVLGLNRFLGPDWMRLFTLYPHFEADQPASYWQMFSYTLGHANRTHLVNNLSFLLLLGPILEERYGSWRLLGMMLFTAVVTAAINLLFFRQAIIGASGIVFMFIILVSFVNVERGTVPLTFVLVFVLFMFDEIAASFGDDQVSQLAHIAGGVCGALFGFRQRTASREAPSPPPSEAPLDSGPET
jgi:membrane associated rhomboid family serine protease